MDLEERTIEDSLERQCEVCGVMLTEAEIGAARETAGPFLCTVHAAERLPVQEDEIEADGGAGSSSAVS